jgi:predicted MPP superfamily phosphohydrolase
MTVVVLRTLIVGFVAWITAFNRWCMTDPDDRAKLRRGAALLVPCLLLPLPLAIWEPAWIDEITWVVFCLVVILEGWRLARQAIGFTTARSRAVPVAGLRGGTRSTHALQVRSYEFPGAPHAMDGLTVAFLSDFHCSGRPSCEWYDKVWEVVGAIGPDLVILGGDYIDRAEDIVLMERSLRGMAKLPLRLGAFAVLGNHDEVAPTAVRETLRRAGAVILEDRWFTIRREDGRKFILHGTSAPFQGATDPVRGAPPGGAHISISHTPDNAPQLAKAGSRYILSGHIHGGQICLPFLGPLVAPSRYSRRWAYGGFQVGHSNLVVTSGLGTAGIPLRVLCPPEIVVLQFHS